LELGRIDLMAALRRIVAGLARLRSRGVTRTQPSGGAGKRQRMADIYLTRR
jgi:hypothetical protein